MSDPLAPAPERFERESDKRLFMELRRRLWEYEPLRATRPKLEIDVSGGSVRLSGRVRTLAMKEIAGYICRRAEGVGALSNELISDTEVIQQVATALALEPELAPLCIRVDAREGVVTLSGELPSAEFEQRAIEAAGRTPVVAGVTSELVVRRYAPSPTAPPAAATPSEAAVSERSGG